MRFVSAAVAKGLKVGSVVYTINSEGEYGIGKLISRTETESGVEIKFEVPQYFNPSAPSINPVVVNNITHVCLVKNR